MFYVLNFRTHQFTTCSNSVAANKAIEDALAGGAKRDDIEIVNAFDADVRLTVTAFRALCDMADD